MSSKLCLSVNISHFTNGFV